MAEDCSIVRWSSPALPRLKSHGLTTIMAKKDNPFEVPALEMLLDLGILSSNPQGNYALNGRIGNFPINPKLKGEWLYFTLRSDAWSFGCDSGLGCEIVQTDTYHVPEEITVHDWRVIRLKDKFEQGDAERIRDSLFLREVLTRHKSDKFSVVAEPPNTAAGRRAYLNLGYNSRTPGHFYFETEGYARSFAQSVPEGRLKELTRIAVVQHSAGGDKVTNL